MQTVSIYWLTHSVAFLRYGMSKEDEIWYLGSFYKIFIICILGRYFSKLQLRRYKRANILYVDQVLDLHYR